MSLALNLMAFSAGFTTPSFSAVQASSIGDIVTQSVSHLLISARMTSMTTRTTMTTMTTMTTVTTMSTMTLMTTVTTKTTMNTMTTETVI